MKRRIIYLLLVSIISILIIFSFNRKSDINNKLSKTGFFFDTTITITIYNSEEKYIEKCFEMCEAYEAKFSATLPDSEVSQINTNSAKGEYTSLSDDTLELIKYGIEYSQKSEGLFDITIGQISSLWDITGDNTRVPSDTEIKSAIKTIDYSSILVDGNKVMLTNPNSKLDFGGIAKGYIADKLKTYLTKQGVKSGMINLGGNVLLIGKKPDNSNFNIGIQYPFGASEKTIAIMNTSDTSIVTSGVYQRYFYENNVLYHHILDAKTGYPVDNNLLSVTIITSSSAKADAYSTTAFIKGLNDGISFIEGEKDVEAVFIDKDYKIHLTSGLEIKDNVITKR